MKTSAEIRQDFLDFFKKYEHTIVPSASLIPTGDATLLFTNAGMNQFKDIFLGLETREYTRAADTQKCMRVSGKHNDLEDVGRDGYHHTFFEMLGNWSFGDYFKKEAIRWAWELLTEVWGLPKEKLYATVFEDDRDGSLGVDEEAVEYWKSETDINPERILKFGFKDNFWEMGDTGPCGPCSEIHIDRGEGTCDKQNDPNHVCGVNAGCARFFEIWNLVFIQYNRDAAGELHELPAKHIDTGMGFERVTSVIQDVPTNYDTDLFTPIMDKVQTLTAHTAEERAANVVPYRVIADHGRAVTFLVGDGIMPGNEGRNYTLRMILRRAVRFGQKIGLNRPFLAEVAETVIEQMGGVFPELAARRDFIQQVITQEEERFRRTLEQGLELLDDIVAELQSANQRVIPGDRAFNLWATHGFPLDITRDIAGEQGLSVDETRFHAAQVEHQKLSRAGEMFAAKDTAELQGYIDLNQRLHDEGLLQQDGVRRTCYEGTTTPTTVGALVSDGQAVETAPLGAQVDVILPATPFYVESGGQVGDTGWIRHYDDAGEIVWEIRVDEPVEVVPGLIVHRGEITRGTAHRADAVQAEVNAARRWDIMRNHTATHVLHKILRDVLGSHVYQAGSLVAPDRLRFDFNHTTALTREELAAIERGVNAAILANYPVSAVRTTYKNAIDCGAMALFGEKYGDEVRMIETGWDTDMFSRELCGGTHVNSTADISIFHIVSEGSVGAGLRRIEAVTGRVAHRLITERLAALEDTAAHLHCEPKAIYECVNSLEEENARLRKEIEKLERAAAKDSMDDVLEQAHEVAGVQVLAAQVDAANVDMMREMSDWLRDKLRSAVVVLAAVINDKPLFVAAATDDLVKRGVHAGNMVREVAKVVGGGGGGRPNMAQAGGKDAARIADALAVVDEVVRGQVGE